MLVFVYGSLMNGLHNHSLLARSRFIGDATTVEHAFALVDLGSYPGAVRGDAGLVGEVYDVDAATLAQLDRLEGHPTFYCREECQVCIAGERRTAWVYIYQSRRYRRGETIEPRQGLVSWRDHFAAKR